MPKKNISLSVILKLSSNRSDMFLIEYQHVKNFKTFFSFYWKWGHWSHCSFQIVVFIYIKTNTSYINLAINFAICHLIDSSLLLDFPRLLMPAVAEFWKGLNNAGWAYTLRVLTRLPHTGLWSWCIEAKGDPSGLLDPRGFIWDKKK